MEIAVTDDLKCPVCLEIPESQIFLCQNGHTICDACSTGIKLCPQCRVSLETVKVRNRALEILLDTLKLDCAHKDQGCEKKFGRSEIQFHISSCCYNGKRFNFCKSIGLQCTFSGNLKNLPVAMKHFIEIHGFAFRNQRRFPLVLQNFDKVIAQISKEKNASNMWTPIVVDEWDPHRVEGAGSDVHFRTSPRLFILSVTNGLDDSSSWICVCISNEPSDASKYQVEFTIDNQSDKVPELYWKTSAVDVSQIDAVLRNCPFRIPNQHLLTHYVNKHGNLLVDVKINHLLRSQKETSGPQKEPTLLQNSILHNPEEQPTVSPVAGITFGGMKCQGCGICPITNVRYRSLEVAEYNLCKTCDFKVSYSKCWFAMITSVQQGQRVSSLWRMKLTSWSNALMGMPLQNRHWKCTAKNGCKKTAIFTCLECNEVRHSSLCQSCMAGDPENHLFAMFISK